MAQDKQLIYVNALKDRFKKRIRWLEKDVHDQYSLGLFHGAEYDEKLIDEIPTVEAVEVVHASWIKRPDERICPVCMDRHSYFGGADWNFCKNCGAKMDGEHRYA